MTTDPRLHKALEGLAELAQEQLAKHPLGHLALGPKTRLELRLSLPLGTVADTSLADEAAADAHQNLTRELDRLLAHRAIFKPGRVYCLRCSSGECEHSAPENPRHVFGGYGPSGLPQFVDFSQWILERKHPQMDRLYEKPPRLVTDVVTEAELNADLLSAFRDRKTGYRIHGQVCAGWFRVPRADKTQGTIALTFQVLSSARRKGFRRLGLHILGQGPDGEPLRDLQERLLSLPWAPAAEWGRTALDSIERSQKRKKSNGTGRSGAPMGKRIAGVLNGIARRLQHERRARDRRTGHAEKRHTDGDRPTHMALKDLSKARPESFLFDNRNQTVIVLGARGRAHVWSGEGKLVTSIRYSPDSIQKKKKKEIWRPAAEDEIIGLRKVVGVAG